MVAPVTGPFVFTNRGMPSQYVQGRTWYRQKKPYDLPLPFTSWVSVGIVNTDGGSVEQYLVSPDGVPASYREEAKSKAWSRFVDDVGQRAEMGVNLIEARKSVAMIAARAGQLFRAFKALKKGQFGKVIRELGDVTQVRRKVNERHFASKSLSRQWLELHFGWTPMVQDIYNAVEVLESDFGQFRCKGSGSYQGKVSFGSTGPWQKFGTFILTTRARYGAVVEVVNPNLALATKMGVTNPLSIAWELIPFSFVVDWFANVGQFLNSFNEFLGLKLTNTFTTLKVENLWEYQWTIYLMHGRGVSAYTERNPGLDRPGLYVKPLKRLSVTRAATAISLLIVTFLSGKSR